jgi:sialate O-acetylesterase
MVGNSDVHGPIFMDLDPAQAEHRPMTLVFARAKTAAAIKEALFARRTAIYANNGLFGAKQYLEPIFYRSIKILNPRPIIKGKGRALIQIHNQCAVPFELELNGKIENLTAPNKLTLTPGKTVLCEIRSTVDTLSGKKSVALPYKVQNLKIAPGEGLPVEIKLAPSFQPTAKSVTSTSPTASAQLKLHGLFSDNMVLQQGIPVPIWGWAGDGETVTVQFRDQRISTTAKGGAWMVKLASLNPGGPDTLTVSGKNTITLQNVLVGEVWICSGQSNMEWPLNRAYEPLADIAAAANPAIRLFTVPKLKANQPTNNLSAAWQECNPQTVPGFSAVAYYFGRELQKARQVPVGLIHTSWGGSPAEVWMSQAVLETNPDYKKDILDAYAAQLQRYQDELAKWEKEAAELQQQGKKPARNRPSLDWRPTELYNGMIAPLLPSAIKGAIWYQGESNAGRAQQYRTLFADMIRNWRRDWGQGDFTFLAVQLAPWDKGKKRALEQITAAPGDSDWAELREAQMLAAKALPNVGVAVITDVGDKDDIHPNKKAPVGARLALAARGLAYGEEIEYSGPVYQSMKVQENKVILTFAHVGQGLEARDGELKGFAICGQDKKFVWANAHIQGNTVVVSSPLVDNPIAVRYGWADFPVVNLWNKDGLPASPFRTDDFPMLTAPKK